MNLQDHYYFELSSHLCHSISRVWFIIRDASLISLLSSSTHFPLIVKEGKNTWHIDSEFQCKHNDIEYTGKCIKVKNFPQYKKITWQIQVQSKTMFSVQYSLYQVIDDDSTVLIYKIKFNEKETYTKWNQFFKVEQQNEFNTLIDKINTTLTDSSLNLIQYEGDVIRSSLNEVWECFFNMDLLKKVAPKLGFAVEREGNAKEHNVGDIIKITYDNKSKFYLCKITMINKHENWNKWIYGFDALYGQPKIPYQKCVVTMTKVNEDEVHLAFFHEFKEAVDHNKIALLSKDKKYFIKSLKEYFAKQNGNKKKKEKE